jgi:radical SAM protein with 4Fe4S-binding SPASM domain
MERIAKFHKVSYEQFEGDWKDTFGPIETEEIKTSMECNQCKLRHVCNTCAAAAVAECGDSEGVSKYLCEYTKETVRNLKEFY